MKFTFRNKKISGILTVIPKNEVSFDDEADKFQSTPKQMKRLKEVMGFDRRRVVEAGTSFSDLAVFGLEKLFADGLLNKDDIGALIVVTHHPDYFTPPASNIIQGSLDLPDDVYCLDINDGCSGYILGLIQAFQLLEHLNEKKVLLVVGMVRSKKGLTAANNTSRNSLLWGDAVSINVIENNFAEDNNPIVAEIKMYGKKWDCIRRPAEGLRKLFATQDTADVSYITDTVMNGGEVLKFTQIDVPSLIEAVLKNSGKSKSEFDWFLFARMYNPSATSEKLTVSC